MEMLYLFNELQPGAQKYAMDHHFFELYNHYLPQVKEREIGVKTEFHIDGSPFFMDFESFNDFSRGNKKVKFSALWKISNKEKKIRNGSVALWLSDRQNPFYRLSQITDIIYDTSTKGILYKASMERYSTSMEKWATFELLLNKLKTDGYSKFVDDRIKKMEFKKLFDQKEVLEEEVNVILNKKIKEDSLFEKELMEGISETISNYQEIEQNEEIKKELFDFFQRNEKLGFSREGELILFG